MTTLGDLAERITAMETSVEDLNRIVKVGNGEPSLQMQVTKMIAGMNLLKWMIAMGLLFGALVVSAATWYVTSFESRHRISAGTVSSITQNAGNEGREP